MFNTDCRNILQHNLFYLVCVVRCICERVIRVKTSTLSYLFVPDALDDMGMFHMETYPDHLWV